MTRARFSAVGVSASNGGHVVEIGVVVVVQDRVQVLLERLEVVDDAHLVQRLPRDRHLDVPGVPVKLAALAGIAAQRVRRVEV